MSKKNNLTNIFNKCKEIIEKNKGILLTKEFKTINTRLRIICLNGHLFTRNKQKIFIGSWCKKCKIFKNESICRYIFESLFECKFIKCRPTWLINSKTNRKLELDGYNEQLKIAFEYDGEYHYKKTKKLINQQYRDNIKNELCKQNNINLIRIPYTIHKNNYQNYIINICKQLNIKIKNYKKVDLSNIQLYYSKLDEIKIYAKNNKLTLLSLKYLNSKTKLEWICNNKHKFFITYYNLKKRKNKCLECKNCV